MSKYEIEQNVPLPTNARNKESRYPFATMKVGDTFFVSDKHPSHVRNAACHFQRKLGVKFIVRKDGEGLRCWRIE